MARASKLVASAVNQALAPPGLNLIQANGPAAGQTVWHYHVHVFPRRSGDDAKLNWGHEPGDMRRIEQVYGQIMEALA